MKCEDCKYFVLNEPDDDIGSCHRYPPMLEPCEFDKSTFEGYKSYPWVFPCDDWCGEFQPKGKNNE